MARRLLRVDVFDCSLITRVSYRETQSIDAISLKNIINVLLLFSSSWMNLVAKSFFSKLSGFYDLPQIFESYLRKTDLLFG